MNLQQNFKAALRDAYQRRRENGVATNQALSDAVNEVWGDLIKPLAVIDPEDRDEIKRLSKIFCAAPSAGWVYKMQDTLREFAIPKRKCTASLNIGGTHYPCEGDEDHSGAHGSIHAEATWGEAV